MPEDVEVLGLAYADVGLTGYKLRPEFHLTSAVTGPRLDSSVSNGASGK
jgi:hypothetical protein